MNDRYRNRKANLDLLESEIHRINPGMRTSDMLSFERGQRTPNAMPTDWIVAMKIDSPALSLKAGQVIGTIIKFGKHDFVPVLRNCIPDTMDSRNTRDDAATALLAMAGNKN